MPDLLITAVLALIMVSIGLSLRSVDFNHLFFSPKPLVLGLFLQLIALPALAFTVMDFAGLPPAFSIGFLILAACPGGLSSNFISFLLRANTALAVSLTICNSALSMLTVPFLVNLALDRFASLTTPAHLPLLPTAARIFLIVLLPVITGMLVRHFLPRAAEAMQPRLRILAMGLLAAVFVMKLTAPPTHGGSALTVAEVGQILPVAIVINVLALALGWAFGSMLRMDTDNQVTLGVEVGIQNTSLAFLIAGSFLASEQALKPALVYAMFTFFTAVGYGLLLKPAMLSRLRKELSDW